jgi:hypothetical protein
MPTSLAVLGGALLEAGKLCVSFIGGRLAVVLRGSLIGTKLATDLGSVLVLPRPALLPGARVVEKSSWQRPSTTSRQPSSVMKAE